MSSCLPLSLPEGFRFGVATSGYQIEGGYNGPGEPANDWAAWEQTGRVEPSGISLDFWHRYGDQLDRAAALGCDSFRLSVEWARCQPQPGGVDEAAFDHYAGILACARSKGLEPVVALNHFTLPAWSGTGFWVSLDAPECFRDWVDLATDRLQDHCRCWVTVNEPNVYAIRAYVTGAFPPGERMAVGKAVRCLDHLLAAHVLAADSIHRRQPGARVTSTTRALQVYELDQLIVDVLLARRRGIPRRGIGAYLEARRAQWYSVCPSPHPAQRVLRRMAASALPLDQALPRTISEVYRATREASLDFVQIGGGAAWRPHLKAAEPRWLEARSLRVADADVLVEVEGGGRDHLLRRGRPVPRPERWDRSAHLRDTLASLVRALDAGAPVAGYWHAPLADDYQWGSYESRLGLYGVDHARGGRWSALDANGHDAAGAYRRLITGLRAGDRAVLRAPGAGA